MPQTAAGMVKRTGGREKKTPPVGVVLIDPLRLVRVGLKLFIEEQPDMLVMAEASSPEEALAVLTALRRKTRVVALVGLTMGGSKDAFWLIRKIRETFPSLTILAMGSNGDGMAVSRALFVGADGYVDKSFEPHQFLEALRNAVDGEVVLEGVPRAWLGEIAEGLERQRESVRILTERELEVLAVAAEGLTAREIGTRLGVRERTVTTHLGRIYNKLGVGGRVGAVRAAARVGLVTVHLQE
jgi:DNA-binding NarL/FixJ family response regulator